MDEAMMIKSDKRKIDLLGMDASRGVKKLTSKYLLYTTGGLVIASTIRFDAACLLRNIKDSISRYC